MSIKSSPASKICFMGAMRVKYLCSRRIVEASTLAASFTPKQPQSPKRGFLLCADGNVLLVGLFGPQRRGNFFLGFRHQCLGALRVYDTGTSVGKAWSVVGSSIREASEQA